MTYIEMGLRIAYIARRSSSFKIGKSGQTEYDRLKQHSKKYRKIVTIVWSADKTKINTAEKKMIADFINWKNCENKKGGSAGEMKDSKKYILYIIYIEKRK